jgi:hypothetical protein
MFINIIVREKYPEEYKYYMFMKFLYIFSKMQIYYNKIHKFVYKSNPFLISFLNAYEKSKQNKNQQYGDGNLDFILDGKVIESSIIKSSNDVEDFQKKNCDFAIYSDYLNLRYTNHINKKIIQFPNNSSLFHYEVCDIRFLLCELIVGDNVYKINLHSDTYNYYISNNVINKSFFIYYMQTHYEPHIIIEENVVPPFIFKILDHNVNSFEIDMINNYNNIKFTKDSYIINMLTKTI